MYSYESFVSVTFNSVKIAHSKLTLSFRLVSNANDAVEKVRLMSLTDSKVLEPAKDLNVTVLADKEGGRIVIRGKTSSTPNTVIEPRTEVLSLTDTGIGMNKEQLAQNLGTIARSGTAEFVQSLEKKDASSSLIGQFGLGFYSSFLVASRVTVASKSVDSPTQYVFESEADAEGFRIYEDPRGNTLGRGTEITLWLKEEAGEYLEEERLKGLIRTHSEYNSAPIYLLGQAPAADEAEGDEKVETSQSAWELINDLPPLWMRDPKELSDSDYEVSPPSSFPFVARTS